MTNVRTNYQETSDNGYLEARSKYLGIFMNRAYSWLKRCESFFQLTNEYAVTKDCVVTIKAFSQRILDFRREARRNRTTTNEENGLTKTVLDLFLDAGVPDSQVRDHIDTFIVAVSSSN